MLRRIALAILVLSLLSTFAIAQQTADDAVNAVKNLEQYREGLIKLWMNDFGNLGRYREANTKLAPRHWRTNYASDVDSLPA
jgi:hypothetical protein